MEEKNKEIVEKATQIREKMTEFCDAQGEKTMDLLKKNIPAVEEMAKDPAKLSKTTLLINIAATAIMLLSFYLLPASPNIKGGGSITLNSMLNLFGQIADAGFGEGMGRIYLTLFVGRVLIIVTFANFALGLYTLFTEKVLPYVTTRLLSLLTTIFMVLLLLVMLGNALIGVYIALLASFVVGLTGLVSLSKR